MHVSLRGALLVCLTLALARCQCARLNDVIYACEVESDCAAGERCVADGRSGRPGGKLCIAAAADGGADGGPLDAGATDAGQRDSGGDADPEQACGNEVDDDGDGKIDCLDEDCAGLTCRARAGQCDLGEVCTGGQCPADARANPGTPCDDDNVCTNQDQCTASGQCVGVPGVPLYRCTRAGVVEILSREYCPDVCDIASTALTSTLLAYELPDAGTIPFYVKSPLADDGGCTAPADDGGVVTTANICADWTIDNGGRPGTCQTNTLQLAVSAAPFDGGVAVYQYSLPLTGPPRHQFGTSTPANSFPDPFAPLFYACPP